MARLWSTSQAFRCNSNGMMEIMNQENPRSITIMAIQETSLKENNALCHVVSPCVTRSLPRQRCRSPVHTPRFFIHTLVYISHVQSISRRKKGGVGWSTAQSSCQNSLVVSRHTISAPQDASQVAWLHAAFSTHSLLYYTNVGALRRPKKSGVGWSTAQSSLISTVCRVRDCFPLGRWPGTLFEYRKKDIDECSLQICR